ncbi:hypothetical protein [Neisseria sicca]|uniref:Uncharacterized protein n=1 Tax=Neisseria sicca VK64 TaxID=1095748 RepID=I2NSQ5_NEISI|nr:hypothetical protein [Neisseria sicca]EIG28866.1 hypothetical protein HMPREF1051_2189 [Neisseria sicca VK64]
MDKIRMMEKEQVGSLIGTGEDFKRMGRSSENQFRRTCQSRFQTTSLSNTDFYNA